MPAPARIHRLSPTAHHLEPLTEPATAYLVRADLTLPNGRPKIIRPAGNTKLSVNVNNPNFIPTLTVRASSWAQVPTGLSIDLAPNIIALIQPIHHDLENNWQARPGILVPGQNGELVITIEIRKHIYHRHEQVATIMQGDPLARLVFQEAIGAPPVLEEGVPDRFRKA